MGRSAEIDRYSTVAEFELVAGGKSYRVAQVAANWIILDRPVDIPPCDADLYIRVEGEELHRRVRLPQGASVRSDEVIIERE